MPPSLRMELKPSLLLAGSLAAVHLLAVAAAAAALGGWALLLVAAGVVLSGALTVTDALHGTARSVRALELHADGRCAWRDGAGRWREGRLHGRRFIAPGLIVLGLEGSAGRRWIVLLPDASDRDHLRRLRVWLHWRADATHGDAPHDAEPGIGDRP
jgi:membrane-bound toxin of toxin-antitoxin system